MGRLKGFKHSKETIRKMCAAKRNWHKEKGFSKESKAKIARTLKRYSKTAKGKAQLKKSLPKAHKAAAKAMKKNWDNRHKRKRMTLKMKATWRLRMHDPKLKKQASRRGRNQFRKNWKNKELRAQMIEAMRRAMTPERIRKSTNILRALHKIPGWTEKTLALARKHCRQRPSNPQLWLFRSLRAKGYKVKLELPCGPYSIDIALPKQHLAIEVDGEYWHKVNKTDYKKRDKFLRSKGWKRVIRVSEYDVKLFSARFAE